MSVNVNLRSGKNQLIILDLMSKLCTYTFERTQKPVNKKDVEKSGDFPKEYRRLANQIWDTCYHADKYISLANDYTVHSHEDYLERRKLQLLGRGEFKHLPRLIYLAYIMNVIDTHRYDTWLGLVDAVEGKLDNWIKENEERFSNIG